MSPCCRRPLFTNERVKADDFDNKDEIFDIAYSALSYELQLSFGQAHAVAGGGDRGSGHGGDQLQQ